MKRRVLFRGSVEQGRAQIRIPDQPGLYALTYDDGTQVEKLLSVNPPPKESQLTYVDTPETIKVWRVNLPVPKPPSRSLQPRAAS